MGDIYLAIDIGAGQGIKNGLFLSPHRQLAEGFIHRNDYADTYDGFVAQLLGSVARLLEEQKLSMRDVRSIGIASPGLFRSDGSYQLAANLTFLSGRNLKESIERETGVPTGIDNDANLGGLAEWSVLQNELLYWVFGGGWGGAWISQDGSVRFPTIDWDENDESLHYASEPGYGIPLDKLMLKTLFYQHGVSFDRFEQIAIQDTEPNDGTLTGPGGNPDTVRAEVILSGPGRCRLFRAVVADDEFYERFLDIHETKQMMDPSVAGKHISKLSSMRVDAAVNTDRLFGRILAQASLVLIRQARKDGIPEGLPVCLGGKPSYALPYFGPSAQSRMGALGMMSYMRPSVIDERGLNANLVGAAVLAQQIGATLG